MLGASRAGCMLEGRPAIEGHSFQYLASAIPAFTTHCLAQLCHPIYAVTRAARMDLVIYNRVLEDNTQKIKT